MAYLNICLLPQSLASKPHFFWLNDRKRHVTKPQRKWLPLLIKVIAIFHKFKSLEGCSNKKGQKKFQQQNKVGTNHWLTNRIKVKKHIKWTKFSFLLMNRFGASISFIQIIKRCQSFCKLLQVEVVQGRNAWTATATSKLVVRYDVKFDLWDEIYMDSTLDEAIDPMFRFCHTQK